MDGLTLRRRAILDPLRRRLSQYGIASAYKEDQEDTLLVSVRMEQYECDLVSTMSVRLLPDFVQVSHEKDNRVLLADPELETKLMALVLRRRELHFNLTIRDGANKFSVTTFVERIDGNPVRCFTTTSDHFKPLIFNFMRERARPWLPRNLHHNIERVIRPLIESGVNVSCYHLFPWDLYTVDYSQVVDAGTEPYRYRSVLWSHLGDDFADSLLRLIGTTRRIVMWRIDH